MRRTLRPDAGGGPLRVTLCPVNTAGVPWTTAEALRRRGIDARLVVFERYALHPEADISLDRSGGFAHRQLIQWQALARLLPQTDVFHFVFGLTLVPQSFQYPALRLFRKKSVMHYLGSASAARHRRAGFREESRSRDRGQLRRDQMGPGGDGDPAGIDLAGSLLPAERQDETGDPGRPLVEAPQGHRARDRRGQGLDADLEIVEGLHHDEAFERYRNADIVVDQLHAGWYGLLAIECMALGKPVDRSCTTKP